MSRDKSRGKSNKYANVECYHCKKKGHIKRFCREFKMNKGKEVKKEDNSDDETNSIGEFNIVYNDDIINLTT